MLLAYVLLSSLPSSLLLEGVEPLSTCELEVDAVAADILNRLDIEGTHRITLTVQSHL